MPEELLLHLRVFMQVTNAQDAATAADKRMAMSYKSIEHLAFSFRNIRVIENLAGLVRLTKLQLDNNCITRIQNLDHLVSMSRSHGAAAEGGLLMVASFCCYRCLQFAWAALQRNFTERLSLLSLLPQAQRTHMPPCQPFAACSSLQVNLTWLDLSFNAISKIEGLDKLTKLTDLSLFCNHIEKIENLQTLTNLSVLSIGEPLCDFNPHSSRFFWLTPETVMPPATSVCHAQTRLWPCCCPAAPSSQMAPREWLPGCQRITVLQLAPSRGAVHCCPCV